MKNSTQHGSDRPVDRDLVLVGAIVNMETWDRQDTGPDAAIWYLELE